MCVACYITTLWGVTTHWTISAALDSSSFLRTDSRARAADRTGDGSADPRAQQDRLPAGALADLDIRLLHRPRSDDLRAVRARFDAAHAVWLAIVLIGTGIAGLRGKLPGVEPRPYIIRFTEDRPNPLYRRICYTLAWSEAIAFAVLNIAGLVIAIVTGRWRLRQIYDVGVLPDCRRRSGCSARRDGCRASRRRPRARGTSGATSTDRCGPCASRSLCCGCCGGAAANRAPPTRSSSPFSSASWRGSATCARLGLLPRTRPIVPGELAVSD